MFIDREQELAALERMWNSRVAEFFVLYGRRRVGKTELLLQFCKNKRSIYFLASQLKESDHLRQLTEAARHVIDDPLLQSLTFSDWEAALVYFALQAAEERLVLVLDEFQYLCEDNAALPSLIQRFWDLHGKNSKLFLILCGSQVSFMEREVLAEKSPLYGRRTGQLQLMPLPYRDSGRFFPEYSAREKIVAYGILGGIPAYLNRFDPQKTLEQNIKDELLSPTSYLFDEVNFLLRMELRDTKTYASLLHAIASGATRLNEIAQRVGAHWESGLDIDVLTRNVDGSHWFGECKWWDAPVGENVLDRLIENSKKVKDRWKRNPRYLLFSAGGFTEGLKQRAETEGIVLIEVNDLF